MGGWPCELHYRGRNLTPPGERPQAGRPWTIAVSRPSHQTQYPLRLPWPGVGRPVGPGRRGRANPPSSQPFQALRLGSGQAA